MTNENPWLDNEILQINKDFKKNKRRRSPCWTLILMFVFSVFFCSSGQANSYELKYFTGKNFKCQKCGIYQWQTDKNADFKGDFFCVACKKKL